VAKPTTSLTAIARAMAEHNEQQVLVARGLENERRVTLVRVVALLLGALSQAIIGGLSGEEGYGEERSSLRAIVLLAYAIFTFGAFYRVRRTTGNVVRARWIPILSTTMDVGFVLAMDWADHVNGHAELEGTCAMLALIISYSILRYSTTSLWYSTALAIVAFTTSMYWSGELSWPRWTFVAFVYVALSLLLYSTRIAVRRAFVDLKRRETLSKLVPAKVVDEILAGREDALKPARRDVTVLFSDVRDFTTYSEAREPEQVLDFLDDYFGRMTQVVQGHDGSVNKFIGDGLLALWGAPGALEDHAWRAVKAALDMQKVMEEINAHREARGEARLAIGIGIHTGSVAAGMLGSGGQSEYSVIGDAVNLASRIEGLTKEAGRPLLVSEATWARVGERCTGERIGEFAVKGRKAPVVVYALTATVPKSQRSA
jgi:adenylate cyclase